MSTTPGSSDPSRSLRTPKSVSDADALDVKGGMTSGAPSTTPTLKPIVKPGLPRLLEPCL
jgi:hypothetical protein